MTTTASNLVFHSADQRNLVSYHSSCQFNCHYEESDLIVAECCNLEDKTEDEINIWDDNQEWEVFDAEAQAWENYQYGDDAGDIESAEEIAKDKAALAEFMSKPSLSLSANAFNLMMGMPVDDLEIAQQELTEYDRALGLC